MPKIQRLNPLTLKESIESINADAIGQEIMGKKTQIYAFEITDLSYEALNILKQEALSVGAECATPRGVIAHKGERVGILFGTHAQIHNLLKKLSIQPFGLKALSQVLLPHLRYDKANHRDKTPAIMAIINITPDSFYVDSRHNTFEAIEKIEALLQKDVSFIDIGAASSRPGSDMIESSEEIARLKDVVAYITQHHCYDKVRFSIDTYNPQTADYALHNGFSIVNDVSGIANADMAHICAKHKAQVILMHTKGTPKSMQTLTHTYTHLFNDIDDFFEHKIRTLKDAGAEDIILDIGFGFAKDSLQNIDLIKHLAHFKHFGLPLLIGASRKSTIGELTKRATDDRLAGTLALHLYALFNGADILRVHDVDAHIDILRIYKAMQ